MIIHPCACLFVYLVVSLFVFLLAGLSALSVCLVRPFVCPTVCLSALPSVCPSICLSVRPSVRLSFGLPICLFVCLSIFRNVCLYVRLPAYQCPTKSVGPFSSYKTHATHNIPVFVLTMSLCSACQFMKTVRLPIYIIK